MTEEIRQTGTQVISLALKNKRQVKTIENNTCNFVNGVLENDEYLGAESFEDVYNRCIYQIYGDLLAQDTPKNILVSIKNVPLV